MVKLNLSVPEDFYREEIRCDYTVTTKRKQIWAVELELLHELDRVCRKYDIHYCADGGTLLGAVRHRGFIPWDDDLDIAMLRSEYEKLNAVASSEFKAPYFWQTDETDPGSARGHAQLRNSDTTCILKSEHEKLSRCYFNQGIFIDIFPFDAVTEDREALKEQYRQVKAKRREYRGILNNTDHFYFGVTKDRSGKRDVKDFVRRSLRHVQYKVTGTTYEKSYREFIEACECHNDETDSQYVADFCMPIGLKRIRRYREDFEHLVYRDFEFLKVPVFENYDRNLRMLYGDDYMTPIRAEDEHGGVIMDTGRPYTEYL